MKKKAKLLFVPVSDGPAAVRDAVARSRAVQDMEKLMQVSDAFAQRMRRAFGAGRVRTYHRGLAGSFVVADHTGDGIDIHVHSRMAHVRTAENGVAVLEPRFRIEVCGNGEFTEQATARIVRLLMRDHLARHPKKKKEQDNGKA